MGHIYKYQWNHLNGFVFKLATETKICIKKKKSFNSFIILFVFSPLTFDPRFWKLMCQCRQGHEDGWFCTVHTCILHSLLQILASFARYECDFVSVLSLILMWRKMPFKLSEKCSADALNIAQNHPGLPPSSESSLPVIFLSITCICNVFLYQLQTCSSPVYHCHATVISDVD